jgi:hypothetical protein
VCYPTWHTLRRNPNSAGSARDASPDRSPATVQKTTARELSLARYTVTPGSHGSGITVRQHDFESRICDDESARIRWGAERKKFAAWFFVSAFHRSHPPNYVRFERKRNGI